MGFGWTVSGCLSCTAVGCNYGVRITVKHVATRYAGSLPLSIETCADDGSCLLVKVSEAGGVFACDVGDTLSFANCVVTPSGDVSLNHAFKAIPKTDVAAIALTVRGSADTTLFETTQDVALHDIELNGPGCGVTCQSGDALFVP